MTFFLLPSKAMGLFSPISLVVVGLVMVTLISVEDISMILLWFGVLFKVSGWVKVLG